MDPRSGAILAMANWPQVNANDPASSSPESLQNRAVGFDYEPGSTFKAFTVAGAVQRGLLKPTSSFYIPDKIQVADRTIHDDTEHGDESLTTAQILAQSSNVGAIKIGLLEGKSDFSNWVSRFGFGKRQLVTPLQMASAYAAIANGGILRPPHIIRSVGSEPQAVPTGRRVISSPTAASLRQMLE